MKLRNEVVVAAALEETWRTLLDVPRVAQALPGASIEADGVEGVYRGTMRVKLGPVTTEYTGVATLEDADEDERVATFRVQGREARGQGTATATITNRLVPEEEGLTRVIVETELAITGRAAQFGRGILEDVSGRLLEQFASRLEAEVLGGEAARVDVPATGDEALDLGGAVWRPLLRRYGWIALAGAGVLALAVAARSRRIVIVVERR
jgi:carbon monoxide dehydrogenase subunit G